MRESLILAGLCLLLSFASLGALAWVVLTGPIFTLDNLLLILVCLLLAGAFGLVFLILSHDLGLLAQIRKRLPQLPRRQPMAAKAEADPPAPSQG